MKFPSCDGGDDCASSIAFASQSADFRVKQRGIWTERASVRVNLLLSKVGLYVSAYEFDLGKVSG